MLRLTALAITLISIHVGASGLLADDKEDQRRLIKSIVASWEVKKGQVKTLTCVTKVESLFAKGYISREFKDKNTPPKPASDQRVSDQPCSWAIDFAGHRVRKEYELSRSWFYGDNEGEIALERRLHLVAEGKYRVFTPKGSVPAKMVDTGALIPEVNLHGDASHNFLLDMNDLPLVWLGGGVTGQWPQPTNLRFGDAPERFTFHGVVVWNDRKCAVLTVPEQQSKTMVREFLVSVDGPHTIYRCLARDGDVVAWQVEVEYREQGGQVVPSRWTCMENRDGRFHVSETYSVEKIELNAPIPDGLFEKALEPGMIVHDTMKNDAFSVNPQGELVPLRGAPSRALTLGIAIGVLVVVSLSLSWWFLRKRFRMVKTIGGSR